MTQRVQWVLLKRFFTTMQCSQDQWLIIPPPTPIQNIIPNPLILLGISPQLYPPLLPLPLYYRGVIRSTSLHTYKQYPGYQQFLETLFPSRQEAIYILYCTPLFQSGDHPNSLKQQQQCGGKADSNWVYINIKRVRMASIQDNPLFQIREMANNDPESLRQVASRIYDKKLKAFLVLGSKEQVLQNCQQLLITKTVEYMNAITSLETSQLKILNSLNESLNEKNATIAEYKASTAELRKVKKQQEISIQELRKEVRRLSEDFEETKIKLNNEEVGHYKSKIDFQKRNDAIRGEFYESRGALQGEIKELSKALEEKGEELKSTTMSLKIEINNIKAVKEREILELNRKIKEITNDYLKKKEEMVKENKYLQNLVEVRTDEIESIKRIEKPVVVANKRVFIEESEPFEITILPTIPEKVEREETPKVLKSKGLERLKKTEEKKPERTEKTERAEKIERLFEKKEVEKVSRGDMMNMEWSPQPSSALRSKKINTGVQTAYADPFEGRQVTEMELELRYYLEEQYANSFDLRAKELNKKYQEQYKNTMGVIRTLIFDLTSMSREQIELSNTKVQEMENMYCQRPSREEDLEYILTLVAENKNLTVLCQEAEARTESAYQALRQYHTKLESYKRLVPMAIIGKDDPPHIIHRYQNRFTTNKDSAKTTRTQFVKNFNSIASWGLSEPTTSRKTARNGRWEDDTFQATKDIITTTEFQTFDNLSPIKRKSAHSKSNNILSMRKKSGIN